MYSTQLQKVESSLIRIQKAITFTNRIFQISNNKFVKFLKRHPRFFIDMLSLRYPLPLKFIDKYELYLNWEHISANTHLEWSEDFIDKYFNRFYWTGRFCLSHNSALPWSNKLVDKYKDHWDWKGIWSLSTNVGIPWNNDLISKYSTKWNWNRLSWNEGIKPDLNMVDSFKDKWNWKGLSLNKSIHNNQNIIQKYPNKLQLNISPVVIDKPKNLTENIIEEYRDKWDWKQLSWDEELPWSLKLIVKYDDRWDFKDRGLSKNEALPWSLELIKKYEERWNYDRLSSNKAVWEKAFSPFVSHEINERIFKELGIESN